MDAAVARGFLEAMQPAQVAISLAPLEQGDTPARPVERPWQLRRERAPYEADLARRRFLAVALDNRLVARPLERDGNEPRTAVATLERASAARPPLTARLVRAAERPRILALAPDVPAGGHAPTTTQAERQQLLRCRINDVTVTKRPTTLTVAIRWPTEACTVLEVSRLPRAAAAPRTAPTVVERRRPLAPTLTDSQIALPRTREGAHAGLGGAFTASKVAWIREA